MSVRMTRWCVAALQITAVLYFVLMGVEMVVVGDPDAVMDGLQTGALCWLMSDALGRRLR